MSTDARAAAPTDTDNSPGEIAIANYDEWRAFQAWKRAAATSAEPDECKICGGPFCNCRKSTSAEPVAWALEMADGSIGGLFVRKDDADHYAEYQRRGGATVEVVPLARVDKRESFMTKEWCLAMAERETIADASPAPQVAALTEERSLDGTATMQAFGRFYDAALEFSLKPSGNLAAVAQFADAKAEFVTQLEGNLRIAASLSAALEAATKENERIRAFLPPRDIADELNGVDR